MKTMKGLSMNKMIGSIKRKAGNSGSNNNGGSSDGPVHGTTPAGSPEATAHDSVKAFCESGGNVKGDEVLFLPPIVDAAESSPAAAAECARIIRKYLSKDYISKPSMQYNSLMLFRILSDNPGATFTRNIDQKFVDTTKALLKAARDPSVRQILMETLDDFENTKMDDENLILIVTMWKKEKEKAFKENGGQMPPRRNQPNYSSPPPNQHSQNYFARNHSNKRLPEPAELANRLEEARSSSKLLEQVVMNTPPPEFLNNELIKEFADRCQSASRSIQGYMISENPTPDNETMESLIDTNELLQSALNQHKRAILNARKHMGLGHRTESGTSIPYAPMNGSDRVARWQDDQASSPQEYGPPIPIRPPMDDDKGKGAERYDAPPGPPPGHSAAAAGPSGSGSNQYLPEHKPYDPIEDPFKDPQPAVPSNRPGPSVTADHNEPRLSYEPFNPGFKTTESYIGRQDSAIGKVQMHGAGNVSPLDGNAPPSSRISQPSQPTNRRVSEISDDDIYDASPRTKEPMYRY